MDNSVLALDFYNDSYFVRSGTIEYTWFTKEAFLEDTGFPFEDGLISLSYEPYKNLYIVDKRNAGMMGGFDLPEIAWVDENFTMILEKGRLRRESETPVMTVSIMREIKLMQTDWVLIRNMEETLLGLPNTFTQEQLNAVLVYRQALRDISNTYDINLPESEIVWPVNPLDQPS